MPLPQERRFSGSNSGSRPYFEGPKSAACVLSKKIAAAAIHRFTAASPAKAMSITPISITFRPAVTERLLKRSARNPPVIENSRKGTAKSRGTTSTNRRSRFSCCSPMSSSKKLTSHLSALSLKAPWNCVAMRLQKPRRQPRWASARGKVVSAASAMSCSATFHLLSLLRRLQAETSSENMQKARQGACVFSCWLASNPACSNALGSRKTSWPSARIRASWAQ